MVEVVFFKGDCRAHAWHGTHQTTEGSICHPSNTEAWKHFNRMYPDFVEEPHNFWLGLCTVGFVPHGQYSCTYSCWPVIITPYNLPSGMCMSSEYIFLTMVIPDPSNPKRLIDVYLESLIKKLLQLWYVGVRTYDHATNRAFMMRTVLMWTVNDLPAYGMASGWSTAGVMGCPIYMDDTRAFHRQHGTSRAKLYGQRATEVSLLGSNVEVTSFNAYFVNGYNFQTERHNTGKSTMNCRVCIQSFSYIDEKNEFYGIIKKIIQLTYPLIPNLHIVLFKCRWVDPVRGMKVHPSYHVIDVNFKKLYQKNEPFILAQQAIQVYFTEYPIAYQPEEVVPVPIVAVDNQSYDLRDPNGLQVVLEVAGTTRRQLHENNDDNENEYENNGRDDETDDDEYGVWNGQIKRDNFGTTKLRNGHYKGRYKEKN
ncbi:hypothetical protein Sango_0650700 [Sesamum angolense]|uniref:DUF4216 domain-containing protein n=1 Tax=Sesamum angolense TaxID=2727404 RepID=A0AAE2C2A4_9LAMI|nr:hypothetical protein Sango_0650700 [Sesamum angolense]